MSAVETRHVNRDSLFLLAEVRVEGGGETHRVKVRNLSAGGMMAEGNVPVERGSRIVVQLRGVGSVDGSVAWVQESRFGIAFAREIDPQLARAPVVAREGDSRRSAKASGILPPDAIERPNLRKI